MKNVHGKFGSFAEVAAAMGIKAPKGKAEKPCKCQICGTPMRKVDGSNVWVCSTHGLSTRVLPNGEEVQVFDKGGHFQLVEG